MLSRYVVTLIEQRVESFKHERFVFRFDRLTHFYSPVCSKTSSWPRERVIGEIQKLAKKGACLFSGYIAQHDRMLYRAAIRHFPKSWSKALRAAGLRVSNAICVVDREEGGVDELARHAVRLRPLFRASELIEIPANPHG